MADTLPNVVLPANAWVDLYDASGITVGIRILVQNLGSNAVKLTTSATEPTDALDRYNEIHPNTNIGMVNEDGDLGAWAYSENIQGLLNVKIAPI